MPLKKYITRVEQLDQLIRMKATGTPTSCAAKLGISKRSLYELITELKDGFGFPIAYDRTRESFVYTKQGAMCTLNFLEPSNNKIDYKCPVLINK